MKKCQLVVVAVALCFGPVQSRAQFGMGAGMGGPPSGPKLYGSMKKLFGEHDGFSAAMEMQTKVDGSSVVMPGQIAVLDGKSRFEMEMSKMKGGPMPPDAAAQMKQMGMDNLVMIARPDKQVSHVVYPGMKGYIEKPIQDANATRSNADFKIETTELGKETVDGHPCIKNKVVVTDKDGKTQEYTVWNATDLQKFPVKIETTDGGTPMVMTFKDVKLARPNVTVFEVPSDFAKHDNMMQMMMKQLGGGRGFPTQ